MGRPAFELLKPAAPTQRENEMISFVPYTADHYADCLRIFECNVPKYFHADEIADYCDYLRNYAVGDYWTCMENEKIIGCGGIRVVENTGRLVYGIVDPDYQGRKHGSALLKFRLKQLAGNMDVQAIKLDTSQHAMGFFRKLGFAEERRIKDGLAAGLDQVDMVMDMTPAMRRTLLAQPKTAAPRP